MAFEETRGIQGAETDISRVRGDLEPRVLVNSAHSPSSTVRLDMRDLVAHPPRSKV